jgi:4-(gamma-glutamylamino)butanal dehydrogenase
MSESWHERAAALAPETRAFIDGAYVHAASGATFTSIASRNGEPLADVAATDGEDIDRAVRSARTAFEAGAWSRAHPRDRKRVLRALTELLLAHRDELGLLIALEMGKPITDAVREIESSARELAFFSEAVDKVFGDVVPTSEEAFGMAVREPIGVVGAVTPWNFPVMMPVYKLGPALAAGNSVVLKPAEQSSLAAIRLAGLAAEAGVPDGVLNVVPGRGEIAGRALGLHPDVDALTFTGSTAVGKQFLRYSADSNMKAVWLECGGKSANVVLADAPDIERAARFAAEAIFHGAGEVCNAGSRLLVDAAIHDELVERVLAEREHWQPGDPLDSATRMGPLVDASSHARVLDYVQIGVEEGAELAAGGAAALADTGGYYVEPTVFTGVHGAMRIAREEIFGPVLATIPLPSADGAAAHANDSVYGLAAAIWTADLRRAHRLARQLKAGTVYVNTYDRGDNSLPFGGWKQSGIGVDRSLHAFEKYTHLKTVWIDLA